MPTIYDFVNRVRNQIRDNGTPQAFPDVVDSTLATPAIVQNNSPELTQFVTDAIAEYSRYRPLKKPYTLNIVAGQTQYTLPTDWMSVDQTSFYQALHPEYIPDLIEYQLPYVEVSAPLGQQQNTLAFNWYDDSQIVNLSVAPVSAYTLNFDYFAYHQADTTSVTVPAQWQYTALLPAYEKAIMAIATDQAVMLQKFKLANAIDIDNSKIAFHLMELASKWNAEFRKQVIERPYGAMGGGGSIGHW